MVRTFAQENRDKFILSAQEPIPFLRENSNHQVISQIIYELSLLLELSHCPDMNAGIMGQEIEQGKILPCQKKDCSASTTVVHLYQQSCKQIKEFSYLLSQSNSATLIQPKFHFLVPMFFWSVSSACAHFRKCTASSGDLKYLLKRQGIYKSVYSCLQECKFSGLLNRRIWRLTLLAHQKTFV